MMNEPRRCRGCRRREVVTGAKFEISKIGRPPRRVWVLFPHYSLSEGRALDYSVYGDAKAFTYLNGQASDCRKSHDVI